MKARTLLLLGLGALTACERTEQTLPFESSTADAVSRPVTASGGWISTPAGAGLLLPAGALSSTTTLSLSAVPAAAPASTGGALGAYTFRFQPAGLRLASPAEVEVRIPSLAGGDAWLASLVNVVPGEGGAQVQEIGGTDIDETNGVVRGELSTLGELTVVVPEPAAVVRVAESVPATASAASAAEGAALALEVASSRYGQSCGAPGSRCAMSISAPGALLKRVAAAALVYPSIAGELRVDAGRVSGRLALDGTVKLRAGRVGDGVPVSVSVEATTASVATPTSDGVRLSGLRVIGRFGEMTNDAVVSLTLRHTGAGRAELVVLDGFNVRVGDSDYPVTLSLPLTRS